MYCVVCGQEIDLGEPHQCPEDLVERLERNRRRELLPRSLSAVERLHLGFMLLGLNDPLRHWADESRFYRDQEYP